MIFYSVLFISCFLLAFIIRRYRMLLYVLAANSVSVVNEIMSGEEDEQKIKSVQDRTGRLSISLLRVILLFVLAFMAGSVPVLIFALLSGLSAGELDMGSFQAIVAISLGATLAFLVPMGKGKESSYSELAQLLHRMVLDNYHIGLRLFRKEVRRMSRKKAIDSRKDFIIVSGLARAGTTSLMNDLARMENMVSLHYANMPLLMSPTLWSKFYKPKEKKLKERSHGDGIMIGLDSNEALEEYFFKLKADDSYIGDKNLFRYDLPEEDYQDYLDYHAIIRKDPDKLYLAKNNNFVLRYASVREQNDEFIMVFMFRDPLTHAASLMEKHREYTLLQKKDPFVLEYMNWLGHHEFGLNQRAFLLGDKEQSIDGDRTGMDYWLKIWISFYTYILSLEHPRTLLVHYDDYCREPEAIISSIRNLAGISGDLPELKPFLNQRKADLSYSEKLYQEAQGLYQQLLARRSTSA